MPDECSWCRFSFKKQHLCVSKAYRIAILLHIRNPNALFNLNSRMRCIYYNLKYVTAYIKLQYIHIVFY